MTVEGSAEDTGEASASGSAPEGAAAIPDYIYFYYIDGSKLRITESDEESGRILHDHGHVRVFFVKNEPKGKLNDERIKDLIVKADKGQIDPVGFAMVDLTLRHKGYMLFVWRGTRHRLEGVDFLYQPDTSKKNHSFEDFQPIQPFDDFSGVFCLNKRVNVNGGPLRDNESDKFEVKFKTNPEIVRAHNEVATNTGP